MSKEYRYSETFLSIQGEAQYTGVPTVWFRSWGCNLTCEGFGQSNPEDKSTWVLDHKRIDVSKYKTLEELPVWKRGCDSSYSWAKKFAHLAHKDTAEGIAKTLTGYLPNGKFVKDETFDFHLAFTGGEPLMSQRMIVDVMNTLIDQKNMPKHITIETNGTQKLRKDFTSLFSPLACDWEDDIYGKQKRRTELFFSVSPKLYLSGETWDDAIKPEIVEEYRNLSDAGQLKFVCNNTEKAWDQVEKATELYRKHGVDWPVWIMPVGGLKEDQETIQRDIAIECSSRGYNFAPRVHAWIFGNQIGT